MRLNNDSDELSPGRLFIHGRLNDPMTGGPLYCRVLSFDAAWVEYEPIYHREDGSERLGSLRRLPIEGFLEETFGGWYQGTWPTAGDLGDQFRFTMGPGRLIAQVGGTLRVPVVAFVGASEFASFRVDLVAGLTMTGVLERVPPIVAIDLPGLLSTPYRAYPVVDHIADKVCALLEVHQRSGHSTIPSTRYRDLCGLVVFAHTATIDAQSLAAALHSEAVRRSLALPDRLTKPRGSGWAAGYARVAHETPQAAERDLDAALVTVGRLIDPVLMGGFAARWDPGVLAWR